MYSKKISNLFYWDEDCFRFGIVVESVAWSIDRDIEWIGIDDDDDVWLSTTSIVFVLITSS